MQPHECSAPLCYPATSATLLPKGARVRVEMRNTEPTPKEFGNGVFPLQAMYGTGMIVCNRRAWPYTYEVEIDGLVPGEGRKRQSNRFVYTGEEVERLARP